MDSSVVVIIVAVVLALLILGVLIWAIRSRGEQKRRLEAQQIRERVDQVSQQVQRREALANETEAKARAAQAEADARAAEAARLQQRAEAHRSTVSSARDELDEQRAHADRIDPPANPQDAEPRTDQREAHPGGGEVGEDPRLNQR